MKITKINYYYTRTVQMRQFEPVVVSMSMEAQIDPGEILGSVTGKVKRLVKEEVETEVRQLKRERLESFDEETEKAV